MSVAQPEWFGQAACRGTDPALWFPTPTVGPHAYRDSLRVARSICRRCPVREECLATALDYSPEADAGIWAGTTATERARLRDPDDGITWDE